MNSEDKGPDFEDELVQRRFVVPLPPSVKVRVEEPTVQKNFRSYITRALGWTAMTPLILLAYFGCGQIIAISSEEDARQVEVVRKVERDIETFIFQRRAVLDSYSDSLYSMYPVTDEQLTQWMEQRLQRQSAFNAFYLINRSGQIQARAGLEVPLGELNRDGALFSSSAFALTSAEGGLEVCFSTMVPALEVMGDRLVACQSTAAILRIIQNATGVLPISLRLVTYSGNVLVQNEYPAEDSAALSVTRDLVRKVLSHEGQDSGIWRTEETRDKAHVISTQHVADTNWFLLASQSLSARDERIKESLQGALFVLGIGILLTLIVGTLVGRSLTVRVNRLIDLVQRFEKTGKIEAAFLGNGDAPEELEHLQEAFCTMAQKVVRTEEMLREANAQLAEKVRLRTASLNSRNEELSSLQNLLVPLEGALEELIEATLATFARLLNLRFLRFETHPQEGRRVSVARGGKLFGFLVYEARDWSEMHASALERLSRSLAIVLENRTLYEDAKVSQQRFQALMEAMTDGVILIGITDSILYANPSARRLLGLEDELSVRHFTEFFEEKYRPLHLEGFTRFSEGHPGETLRWVGRNDATQYVETSFFIVPRYMGLQGERTGVTLRDVSESVRMEKMKRNLISVVAHEFKTPITTIRLQVETLVRRLRKAHDTKSESFLQDMLAESDRLERLVTDWLDVSRIDAGCLTVHPKLLPVNFLLDTAVRIVASQHPNLVVTQYIAEGAEYVLADRDRITQVFVNILENAARYGTKNPTVCRIEVMRAEKDICLSFTDNGPGIPKESLPLLFDMFYQVDMSVSRRVGGTGLGLAICRGIMLAHRGRITVDSTLDVGSVFRLYLPAPEEI